MGKFTLATYNVNSLRSRLHIVLPWLEQNRPDVFCMQETKVEDAKFPEEEFRSAGYHISHRGGKQYNGVAIASLAEPEEISFGFDDGDGPADEERLIRCVFSGLVVLNTYVPQGREKESDHFRYKLNWFRRLRNFLDRTSTPSTPLIWCGDLNVAPEDIDVHSPKRLLGHVCFTPEVWEAFGKVTSWGLIDVFRKHHPEQAEQYTFFDYRVPNSVSRGLGWRIDHILATESLTAKSTACSIDLQPRLEPKPSDHTILLAEFDLE